MVQRLQRIGCLQVETHRISMKFVYKFDLSKVLGFVFAMGSAIVSEMM